MVRFDVMNTYKRRVETYLILLLYCMVSNLSIKILKIFKKFHSLYRTSLKNVTALPSMRIWSSSSPR